MARPLPRRAGVQVAPVLLAIVALLTSTTRAEGSRTTLSAGGPGDTAGRLRYSGAGPYSPSLTLDLRTAAGRDEALLGPFATVYRAEPDLELGLRPTPDLEIFAGGGLGGAYVVPGARARGMTAGPALSLSGTLGARFPLERASVRAVARAESIRGYGTAVTLDLTIDLPAGR